MCLLNFVLHFLNYSTVSLLVYFRHHKVTVRIISKIALAAKSWVALSKKWLSILNYVPTLWTPCIVYSVYIAPSSFHTDFVDTQYSVYIAPSPTCHTDFVDILYSVYIAPSPYVIPTLWTPSIAYISPLPSPVIPILWTPRIVYIYIYIYIYRPPLSCHTDFVDPLYNVYIAPPTPFLSKLLTNYAFYITNRVRS